MGYARENIKDRLKPVRRLSDDLCFPKTNRGQSPRYGWVNASTIFKTPPLKIQKYLNLLLQRPQVFRRRLRSSESLKQWYGLRRQKTRACVPHTPYTSVLKFVLPTGSNCIFHPVGQKYKNSNQAVRIPFSVVPFSAK